MKIWRDRHPGGEAAMFGYKDDASLKAAVSKILGKRGFRKSSITRQLVAQSHAKFTDKSSKNELLRLIKDDLKPHGLKEKHIRDILQEIGHVETPLSVHSEFLEFKRCIDEGHSYLYALGAAKPSAHLEKKIKHWFLKINNGCAMETYKTRRRARQHTYLSLKDELLLNRLDDKRKDNIWTSIGFIFADGAVINQSLQIVITADDSYYLKDHLLPSLLDERKNANNGPTLISAHSQHHETSFKGSKPVARLHIDDALMASFIQELGMPANKTSEGLNIGPHILGLEDKYFYCFLCGLFDGDGSITNGSMLPFSLHLDFDLHSEAICRSLEAEIKRRSGIKMDLYSHNTQHGKRHFKLSATTTPRALSLLTLMYHHSNFHLCRKVERADKLMLHLKRSLPQYASVGITLSDVALKRATLEQYNHLLSVLKKQMKGAGSEDRQL